MSFVGDDRRSCGVAGDLFSQECIVLGTNGFGPPERSGAWQHRNKDDERERRADRAEMVAVAISFLLIISALAAIVGIVLLSRPSRHVPAQWIPWISASAAGNGALEPHSQR